MADQSGTCGIKLVEQLIRLRQLFTHPHRTFSAAADAAAWKRSGMVTPPLAGDPVACMALFMMIMLLSLMRK